MISRVVILCCLLPGVLLAKDPVMTPPDVPLMGEIDPVIVNTLYRGEDREAGLKTLLDNKTFRGLIEKHDLKLFGGPMLGKLQPDAVSVWVRTLGPATVQLTVESVGDGDSVFESVESQTSDKEDYTTVLNMGGLTPFTEYRYNIHVDGEPVYAKADRPTFRTAPKPGAAVKFSVGFGGGARYISEKERIWETIAGEKPLAFLFLGDNLYIDEPEWRNRQRAMYYRRQVRPEYRTLTARTACYAIWDDHDFGKNDTAGGPKRFTPDWKLPVWRVFRENWVNPAYGGGPDQPGCWYSFRLGDVEFFMTDGRYYRSFRDGTMLGPVQKAWLLQSLKKSDATFKVLVSGTLWTEFADKGGADSWWGVPEEREEIFSLIDREQITGVFLLSADRHRNDIYRIKRKNGYDLYEFETSKLTNDHTHKTNAKAVYSYNKGNFFGLLRFDFTVDDPSVAFECISIDGDLIHRFPLKLSELKANGD